MSEEVSRRGYVWRASDGKLFMQHCPECRLENWAMAVASGECAWCGYKAKEEDVRCCWRLYSRA